MQRTTCTSRPQHGNHEGQTQDGVGDFPGGSIDNVTAANIARPDHDAVAAVEAADHLVRTSEGHEPPRSPAPIQYPKLHIPPSPPKPTQHQRKPGMTRPPSYISSPISSPFASPPNVGRKRANAVSLANSPARRSHSENMSRIFRQSRRTVEFQDENRKSGDGRRYASAAECGRAVQATGEEPAQPCLPALAPVGRLSDELAGDLFEASDATAAARLARARTLQRSLYNGRAASRPDIADAAKPPVPGPPLSPVERWLTTIPDGTSPKPNISSLRTPSRGALSPQAMSHRMCSSASSIAQRIALRSPPPCDTGTTTAPPSNVGDLTMHSNEEEEGQKSRHASVLGRLLKPPVRIPRNDASIWTRPPSRAPLQSPGPAASPPSSAPRKPRKLKGTPVDKSKQEQVADDTPSTSSSTPSDSGSSSILYLPKTRVQVKDPFSASKSPNAAAQATPNKKSIPSGSRRTDSAGTPAPLRISKPSVVPKAKNTPTKQPDDEGRHTRKLTPEVNIYRKGRALRSPRKDDDAHKMTPMQRKPQTLRARCRDFYGQAAASTDRAAEPDEGEAGDAEDGESGKENRDPTHCAGNAGGHEEERIRRDSGCCERGQY